MNTQILLFQIQKHPAMVLTCYFSKLRNFYTSRAKLREKEGGWREHFTALPYVMFVSIADWEFDYLTFSTLLHLPNCYSLFNTTFYNSFLSKCDTFFLIFLFFLNFRWERRLGEGEQEWKSKHYVFLSSESKSRMNSTFSTYFYPKNKQTKELFLNVKF